MFLKKLRVRIECLLYNINILNLHYHRQMDVITRCYVMLENGSISKAKKLLLDEMVLSSDPGIWTEEGKK